jgi:hypothetical protein
MSDTDTTDSDELYKLLDDILTTKIEYLIARELERYYPSDDDEENGDDEGDEEEE